MAQLLWGIGFGLIGPIWPLFMGDLGATPADIGLVIGAGTGVAALVILPAGLLADRIGRRPMVIATSASGMLGALAFLPLTDWHGAFVGAILYWSAIAGLPIVTAHVAAVEGRERMGHAMGMVYGAFFAGTILASPLSGILAASFGPRVAIGSAVALFALSTVAVTRISPTRRAADGATRRLGRSFWTLLAVTPVAGLVAQLAVPYLPLYLRGHAGVPLEQVGVYIAIFAFGSALLSALGGRLADRVGPVIALVSLASLFAAGALTLAVTSGAVPVALGALFLGANVAGDPVMAATLQRILPAERTAFGYAAFQLTYTAGQGAGALLGGRLYETDTVLPLLVSAACALPLSAVVALVVIKMTRRAALAVPT
ncbi:MAG: MFS transporter [Candidatus Limnocylindria bacterium]|nr:MFS transporter [Candidatus Limnocylindria bacterium]